MPNSSRKRKAQIVSLASKGGTDKDLFLLQQLHELEDKQPDLNKLLEGLRGIKGDKGDSGGPGEPGPAGPQGEQGWPGVPGRDGNDGRDGKDGIDGRDGRDGVDGKNGKDGKDGSPDMAEDIRNKLELLVGDERLDASAIKGLEQLIKKLTPKRPEGVGAIISRGTVKVHDLSDDLDGSTKTFSLPAFWRIITVQSSSFPNAFRPDVDYTSDASAFTITFTNEIDAASTLAAGQTILVQYAEN